MAVSAAISSPESEDHIWLTIMTTLTSALSTMLAACVRDPAASQREHHCHLRLATEPGGSRPYLWITDSAQRRQTQP